MPSSDNQQGSPHKSFGLSMLGFGRGQVHSMGAHETSALELELQSFQKHITDRFLDLSAAANDELLSLAWMRKLLKAFTLCQDEFRVILQDNREQVSKPPLDRLVSDFFERSVKALDICNVTRDGIERIRQWERQLQIVRCALDTQKRNNTGEGQIRRASKALMELSLAMLDEKDSSSVFSHRNRSFGRHDSSKDHHNRPASHSRSLSWSVSRSWSAAKQLQLISNNLTPPRGNEISSTNGLVLPVFSMTFVLVFVLWVLVAAIPCQDRGLHTHLSMPRHFSWSSPLLTIYERVLEESKKRERKNSYGLLKEIQQIETCASHMTDLMDLVQFPLTEELKVEVGQATLELAIVCEALNNGVAPLERQVRDMFRGIMNFRMEGLGFLGRATTND